MKTEETVVRHVIDGVGGFQDSLEIGTAKGGAIKVYGDFAQQDAFKEKLDKALALREYANDKINRSG